MKTSSGVYYVNFDMERIYLSEAAMVISKRNQIGVK